MILAPVCIVNVNLHPNAHRSQTFFCPPISYSSTQETYNDPQNQRDETKIGVNCLFKIILRL